MNGSSRSVLSIDGRSFPRTALADVDPLSFDVALVAGRRGVAAAEAVATRGSARYGDLERHVQPDGEVPERCELVAVQEDAVDDQHRSGRRLPARRRDGSLVADIVDRRHVRAVSALRERPKHQRDERLVVVRVAEEPLRRVAPAAVANGGRVVKAVDRHTLDGCTAFADAGGELVREARLPGSVHPVDAHAPERAEGLHGKHLLRERGHEGRALHAGTLRAADYACRAGTRSGPARRILPLQVASRWAGLAADSGAEAEAGPLGARSVRCR